MAAARRILLPMDGSPHADRALLWYTDNLMKPEDELLFLYALETPTVATLNTTTMTGNGGSLAGPGKRLSLTIREKCKALGVRNHARFLEKITQGPGQSIVDAANEEDADIVVMGNRGMGKIKRTFLGSVSDYVLHHAHRPVVIVPPPRDARKTSTASRDGRKISEASNASK